MRCFIIIVDIKKIDSPEPRLRLAEQAYHPAHAAGVPDRRLQVEQPQLEQRRQLLPQAPADTGVELGELALELAGSGRGVAVVVAEALVNSLHKLDH